MEPGQQLRTACRVPAGKSSVARTASSNVPARYRSPVTYILRITTTDNRANNTEFQRNRYILEPYAAGKRLNVASVRHEGRPREATEEEKREKKREEKKRKKQQARKRKKEDERESRKDTRNLMEPEREEMRSAVGMKLSDRDSREEPAGNGGEMKLWTEVNTDVTSP